MRSPCIDVCFLDAEDRCIGCERTADEIAHWTTMGDEARTRVMADLPDRRRERRIGFVDAPRSGEARRRGGRRTRMPRR
ncbi:MAG: DUF1289 domain-containing protein [Acidimicrobiia bacterium]|nr:DUF1289 domain-containing protein [Acidimicrobiia bacterium]